MKRILSVICIILMLLSVSACKPQNVLVSGGVIDTEVEVNADNTVTEPQKQPESQIADTKPEPQPVPEPIVDGAEQEKTETTDQEATVDNTETVTDEKTDDQTAPVVEKIKNDSAIPSFDFSKVEYMAIKPEEFADKTISLYMSDASAFSFADKTEKDWFAALKDHYGFDVKINLRSESTLYNVQKIAQVSGMDIDLIRTKVSDGVSALNLCEKFDEVITDTESAEFSASVFKKTSGRLFTAKGVAKTLWYNKDLAGENTPAQMFEKDEWTVQNLTELVKGIAEPIKLIENNDWTAFASAGEDNITGLWNGNYNTWITSNSSIDTLKAFSQIFTETSAANTGDFAKGTCLFEYTDAPTLKEGKADWAPIPKYTDTGKYIADFCGYALGVSKTSEHKDIALFTAALWSTRYSEARLDSLINDYAFSTEDALDYIKFCETNGGLYSFDAQINKFFEGTVIPEAFCTTENEVYNSLYKMYNRSDIINARYL